MSEGKLRAVIDLGSNTFHFLIARVTACRKFEIIHRLRKFVALAEEGVGRIGEGAFQRGLDALKEFSMLLKEAGISPDRVRALGTATLRHASNSALFIRRVKEELGISIEVIDGREEARLISLGVRAAVPFDQSPKLIMDIGGGSIEFIIANAEGDFWSGSFPIGILELYNQLKPGDPFTEQDAEQLHAYLSDVLQPLAMALAKYKVDVLVGASGSFDVVEYMYGAHRKKGAHYLTVPVGSFEEMFEELLPTTIEERLRNPRIPRTRVRLVVLAFSLIHHIIRLAGIKEIVISDYAMREGMLMC